MYPLIVLYSEGRFHSRLVASWSQRNIKTNGQFTVSTWQLFLPQGEVFKYLGAWVSGERAIWAFLWTTLAPDPDPGKRKLTSSEVLRLLFPSTLEIMCTRYHFNHGFPRTKWLTSAIETTTLTLNPSFLWRCLLFSYSCDRSLAKTCKGSQRTWTFDIWWGKKKKKKEMVHSYWLITLNCLWESSNDISNDSLF